MTEGADRTVPLTWYATFVPPLGPLAPEPAVLRAVDAPHADPDLPPAASDAPLAWLPAALHLVALQRGRLAADTLARELRRGGTASIEGYGLAWRIATVGESGPSFELQPVIASIAFAGLGAAADEAAELALWQLIERRRDRLGLGETDAATSGFVLGPPTRPLAAFSLRTREGARLGELVRLREAAYRAVERLLRFHGGALATIAAEAAARRSVAVDATAAPEAADWEAMHRQWLGWRAEHPRRRPPEGSRLAQWLQAQRGAARAGRLSPARIELLEETGVPLFEASSRRKANDPKAAPLTGSSGWVAPLRADLPKAEAT